MFITFSMKWRDICNSAVFSLETASIIIVKLALMYLTRMSNVIFNMFAYYSYVTRYQLYCKFLFFPLLSVVIFVWKQNCRRHFGWKYFNKISNIKHNVARKIRKIFFYTFCIFYIGLYWKSNLLTSLSVNALILNLKMTD